MDIKSNSLFNTNSNYRKSKVNTQELPNNLSTVPHNETNLQSSNNLAIIQALKAKNAVSTINKGYKLIRVFKTPLSFEGTIYQLNNGHNVVILPKKSSISVATYFKNGSFEEPTDVKGISHYIEHLLSRYVEKQNWSSIEKNAETSVTHTCYHFKLPSHHADELEKYFSEFADPIINPDFSQKTVDKEKPIILAEAGQMPDNDNRRATKLVTQQLFNTQKVFFNTIGTEETIKSITPQKLSDYYNTRYSPNKMTTVIVGDVTPQQGVELVNKYFGKQKNSNIKYEQVINNYKITNHPIRSDIISTDPKIDRATINICLKGVDINNNWDDANSNILFDTLNQKSEKRFKEFDGSINISNNIISTDVNAPNFISIDAFCDRGKEEEFLKAIYKNIEEIKRIPLSQNDIDTYKNSLKLGLSLSSEQSNILCRLIGRSFGVENNIQSFEDRLKIIDKITSKSLMDFANKYFDLNKASIVVIHPQEKSTVNAPKKVSFTGKSPIFETKDIKQYTLKNNINLVIQAVDDISTTKIDFSITSKDIPKQKTGTFALFGAMIRKSVGGVEKEFFKQQLKLDSIDLDTSIGQKSISFSPFCRGEQATKAVEMALKLLAKPDLTQNNLDEIKKDYRNVAKVIEKEPDDFVQNEIYKHTIIETTLADILNNFENTTLDDIKSLHKGLYSNSIACATIVLPKTEALKQERTIIDKLSSIPIKFKPFEYMTDEVPEAITPIKSSKVYIKAKNEQPQNPDYMASITQTFKIVTPNKHYDPKLAVGLSLLNLILGASDSSRLMKDLREKQGLAYEVSSSYDYFDQLGSIKLAINTNTKDDKSNIQKAIKGFKDNINKLMYWPISDEELKLAKDAFIGGLYENYETSLGRHSLLNSSVNSRIGLNLVNKKLKAIDEITPEYIQQLAIMLFQNQHSLFAVLAPKEALKANEAFLSKLGEVKDVTINK